MLLNTEVRTPVSSPPSVTSLAPWEVVEPTVTNFLGLSLHVVCESDLSSVGCYIFRNPKGMVH